MNPIVLCPIHVRRRRHAVEFVKVGQGDCLQRRPECTVGDGVFGTRLEVYGLRREVSGDGVSGGQDR